MEKGAAKLDYDEIEKLAELFAHPEREARL